MKRKIDAWNEAGTTPDHPCLCETRTKGGSKVWFQFWNGEFFCVESQEKETALIWKDENRRSYTQNIQWREVQP
jgi:hypothetical protein